MDNRAVSETVGYIMMYSVVIVTITTVMIAGGGSLEATRNQAGAANSFESMELVANSGTDIHRGHAPGRTIPLSTAGGTLSAGEEVDFTVDITSGGSTNTNSFTTQPIVYEGNSAKYVYVGSAIMTVGDDNAAIVREPDFDLGGPLILPIVTTSLGDDSSSSISGSSALVDLYRTESTVIENGSTSNPDVTLTIDTVNNRRAQAWADLDGCNVVSPSTTVECDYTGGGMNAIVRQVEIEYTLSV